MTLISPLKSAEGSIDLPFGTAPFPFIIGPFAMVAVSLTLLKCMHRSAKVSSKYKRKATSRNAMPPATMVANAGREKEENEDGKVKTI